MLQDFGLNKNHNRWSYGYLRENLIAFVECTMLLPDPTWNPSIRHSKRFGTEGILCAI